MSWLTAIADKWNLSRKLAGQMDENATCRELRRHQRAIRNKMCGRKRDGNNGAFRENNRSRAVSFTKTFSRVVAVISCLRFDSDSLRSMVVNSSVAHNLRCTGLATFRAKRIGLDQYELYRLGYTGVSRAVCLKRGCKSEWSA